MNTQKKDISIIQNKFYESLKEKEQMYKILEEENKDEENIEFNYPYYIYQDIKNKENKEKKGKKIIPQEQEDDEEFYNIKKEKKANEKGSKNIQLIKTNIKYNILYEY